MRNTITTLALVALLAGCTTSAQARQAQGLGGALLATGAAAIVAGHIIAGSANLNCTNVFDCDTKKYNRTIDTGTRAMVAGGVVATPGFWTLVVSSIQRPLLVQLENQEERIRVIEELEMIEEALPAEALPTTPYAPMNRPEYQRMP